MTEPLHPRRFRIGMTDEERANHEPGRGIDPTREDHLNRTRSLADVYRIEKVGSAFGFTFRWNKRDED